jgi:aryl-alcohol dehydrogenase-like predicted oxidoreductase
MMERSFGNTGMRVSALGLGCARIGGIFKQDPASFVDLLCAARDNGINFFDTSDMYSQGESETLLGRAFGRRRGQVIIASKVGYSLPAQRQIIARVKPFVRPLIALLGIKREKLPAAVRGALAQNFSPAYIVKAVEGSLRRLRTDYLDLLQLHSPPAEIVQRGEWLRSIETLKRAGKVRFFGISCDTLEVANAALQVVDISAIQVVVSLLEQSFAREIVPRAHERQIAVIARECLANGLLVKPEQSIDLKSYCSSPEQEALRRGELSSYRRAASERGIPLSRLALEYATGLEGVSVALVGVSRLEQLTATLRDFRG